MAQENTFRPTSLIILLALLACTQGIASAQVSVKLSGERLSWEAGGKPLGASEDWLLVRDLAATDAFLPVPVSAKGEEFSASVIGLRFEGKWKRLGDAVELACAVSAQPPQDRAIVVRVALPLTAIGWAWWDDIYENRRIEPNRTYSNTMNWGGLREVSRYMCCAITRQDGLAGISAAVPPHEPRVFRLAYNASNHDLEAEFDLGLSPDAAKLPCRADFRLLLYSHDPKWGFRDALRRYYELFPGYAERRVGEGGIWLLSFEPAKMACPWDWGLRFDEGGEFHAGYDCAHDILPFVYTEPWGRYESFGKSPTPDGKPRHGPKASILTPAELKKSVLDRLKPPADKNDKVAEARHEWAQAEVNSAIERQDGTWIWHHWTDQWSPGNWLSNICLNPDPDLPPPSLNSLMWKRELDPGFEIAKKNGGESGGVYLDSVCGYVGFWPENFRREQWKYADTPLVASWKTKKPAQLHCFSCYELGLQVVQRMRAQDKFVMGNTGPPEMAWFCPLLDMIGTGEHGIGLQADRHYAYMRAYGYRKPMSPMAYDLVNPDKTWDEKERAMHRLLFYAVHPGTGPFQDPLKYEPSRPLFRYYEPLIIWLDLAGWQPITCAKAAAPDALVERYGPGQKELSAITFIAVRNAGKQPATTNVEVAAQALPRIAGSDRALHPKNPVFRVQTPIAWLMVADRPAQFTRAAGSCVVSDIALPPDGTEVIALGGREPIARLWLAQSQQWLDRLARESQWLNSKGAKIIRNGDFEDGLSVWGVAAPPNFARNAEMVVEEQRPLSGKRSMKAVSLGDDSIHGLNQGVTLASGDEYILRFKYSWARPDGAKGVVVPRFGVKGPDGKWASDKYIYFKDLQPTGGPSTMLRAAPSLSRGGKPATFERRFALPAGCSTGFFQFMFERNWGTIWIDDVEITSRSIQEAQEQRAQFTADARKAADALLAQLKPEARQNLLALISAQQPVYEKFRDQARAIADEHTRRCLLLPVQNFADALGRAVEVLTGVTLGLPESPPFADAALGSEAVLTCNLRAGQKPDEGAKISLEGGQGLKLRMPEKSPWGWEDVFVAASFRFQNQPVWLLRRATLRLHTPLEVKTASWPFSSVRQGITVSVRAWMSKPCGVKLGGKGKIGDQSFDVVPLAATLNPATFNNVELPLPAALAKRLDEFGARGDTCKLSWVGALAGAAPVQGETEITIVRGASCPALPKAPRLDGRIDPKEWEKAALLQGFVTPQAAKPASRPTTVLLGHDAANIYLAFLCGGQSKLNARNRAHGGPVWEDDAVEIFLQPPGSEAYYHFAVNAVGSRYETVCPQGGSKAWSPAWQARAARTGDGYVVEMAIPFASLGAKPEGIWRANFGREEADTSTATCWSPTGDGFHTPSRFGELKF